MAIQKKASGKKEKIELVIFALIIILISFFLYKNFFKQQSSHKIDGVEFVTTQDIDLYPPFIISIQDAVKIIKHTNLEIFSQAIKDSGPIGNPNPFLPFFEEETDIYNHDLEHEKDL